MIRQGSYEAICRAFSFEQMQIEMPTLAGEHCHDQTLAFIILALSQDPHHRLMRGIITNSTPWIEEQ